MKLQVWKKKNKPIPLVNDKNVRRMLAEMRLDEMSRCESVSWKKASKRAGQ